MIIRATIFLWEDIGETINVRCEITLYLSIIAKICSNKVYTTLTLRVNHYKSEPLRVIYYKSCVFCLFFYLLCVIALINRDFALNRQFLFGFILFPRLSSLEDFEVSQLVQDFSLKN